MNRWRDRLVGTQVSKQIRKQVGRQINMHGKFGKDAQESR